MDCYIYDIIIIIITKWREKENGKFEFWFFYLVPLF